MRITGGSLLGRQVKVPEGVIRPAMDRMRESVFASLGDLSGLSFLDLFTGSGIIALEAASRGAAYVEAVEMDPVKRKTLLENVKISPVRINCRFMAAELYVKRAKRRFDFVFCDPPFPYRYKWDLIEKIARSPLMGEGSRLLLHRPREDFHDGKLPFLEKTGSKEYGRSVVDLFYFTKNGDFA
ncbi:MAG: RsmD family RNA methyltransferase [Treponema sp.]|jgi:16S rRNA (guanine(966)-N(2))-methyltransferase RsmD|nr:RsmD family RNA methyltransferase [Treponema sp.]